MKTSMLRLCLLILLVGSPTAINGAAIPIWELLTHEEKMGRLFYVFVHLVQQYCKTSDIPDCPKVLTLYGMSNLVSENEHSLDLMDPYQRDAKTIVWERIMRGEFKLPTKFTASSNKAVKTTQKVVDNDVYSSPYEIRVRPPTGFIAPPAAVLNDNSNNNNETPSQVSLSETGSRGTTPERTTIIRLGRSLNFLSNQGPLLPVLTEQDAQLLSRAFTSTN